MTEDVYQFLIRSKRTASRIGWKKEQMRDLELQMLPAGIRYDKDKVQSSPEDPMAKYAVRMDELQGELQALQSQYMKEQQQIVEAIDQLEDDREQSVLVFRFISSLKWEEIEDRMHCSESSVFRAYRRGAEHMIPIVANVSDRKVDSE